MKASDYNLLLPENNSEYYLLYNTMYGSTLRFNKELLTNVKGLLKGSNNGKIPSNLLIKLTEEKFLVDDSVNELELLNERRRHGIEDQNRYDVVIMLTQDCNFSCRYCYEKHKASLMDENTTVRVLRWLQAIIPEVKVLYVSFFGGEPLMAKKKMLCFAEMIHQTCEKNGTTLLGNVTTNGYLLDTKTTSQLIVNGFNNFQITIDGLPVYHDRLRPLKSGKSSFGKVYQNTLNLLQQLVTKSITLRTNFNADNLSSIEELYEMIPIQYRPRVRVCLEPIFRSGNLDANYALTETEIGEKMADVYRHAERMGFQVPDGTSGLGKLTYCFAERKQQVVLNYNGDVFKCSTCDFEKGNRVGFIDKEGLFIKEEKFYDWTSHENFPEACNKCKVLPLCMGGCRLRYLNEGMPKSSCALVPTNASLALKWTAFKRLEHALAKQCPQRSSG